MLRLIVLSMVLFASCGDLNNQRTSPSLDLIPVTEPTLINGQPADPKDWPASMYSSQGNSRCTSTVVGERVLLIAAHCVNNGASARFSVKGETYNAVCTHSPNYRRNTTADWALCLIDKAVPPLPFENVNMKASLLALGDELTLTGYGCVKPGGGGGNDGVYRIGKAFITDLPNGSSNDIVTQKGAALCYGDSGGPAFKVDGSARVLVSVNSRGDIRSTSYLVATHTEMAQEFFKAWTEKNNVQICGMHESAQGCRDTVAPKPKPEPKPDEPQSECKRIFLHVSECLFGKISSVSDESCYKDLGRLFQCLDPAKF